MNELFEVTKKVTEVVLRSANVEFLVMDKGLSHFISNDKSLRLEPLRNAQYNFKRLR